jgi:hypothetical protein
MDQYDRRLADPGLGTAPLSWPYSGAYLGFLRKGKNEVILQRKGLIRDSR